MMDERPDWKLRHFLMLGACALGAWFLLAMFVRGLYGLFMLGFNFFG